MSSFLFLYIAAGALAGVLAGLFGIGGGLVIVPILVYCFGIQGVHPDILMQVALGTSLACILFTSVSSARSHNKRGAVDWSTVKRIVLGILIGTYLGSVLAAWLPSDFLKGFFVIFLYYVGAQMLLGKQPKASRDLPSALPMFGTGNFIGVVSSLVGIGGGTLSVPFLVWCNTPMHRAIGTASAIGFPIAVAGTLGFVINGLGVPNRPDMTLGFVYLPALVGIVGMGVLMAPVGVRLAHSLPVPKLKKAFAVLLFVVGTRMLMSLF
ncbi:sulfite exporter TauE/SafE family protein [Desulfovibrio ferrophilus]|uniref:Probable membrane transporter protein n=1 Tax=Desulfovibrio ferrophilus TaxID=241368 RepID=A0A2Z6AZZ1_9BACT|nr:sulfite exporter TauE/SafE family protein [Desulfovibrio ferrophilus]BBD08837.1 hypothetical protein DFE_2111 [Desulfovibrio ferrophilus]